MLPFGFTLGLCVGLGVCLGTYLGLGLGTHLDVLISHIILSMLIGSFVCSASLSSIAMPTSEGLPFDEGVFKTAAVATLKSAKTTLEMFPGFVVDPEARYNMLDPADEKWAKMYQQYCNEIRTSCIESHVNCSI